MRRRRFNRHVPMPKEEHRINHRIRYDPIRVIGPEGEQLGIMSPREGREHAESYGMDLVEVAPDVRPPVCKVMDYGKFKYERSKKAAANKSSTSSVKTIQLRPKTDDHDLETKLQRAAKFLERGDKVQFIMRMRGRERAYPQRWAALMREHLKSLGDLAKLASPPNAQGRSMSMLVEPARS